MRIRSFAAEWRARRAGHRYLDRGLARSARDIGGPTGWMLSDGWEAMAEGSEAYQRSFDPRVPPSLFVSARDRTRFNHPVPLVERCIEDWADGGQARSDAGKPGSSTNR